MYEKKYCSTDSNCSFKNFATLCCRELAIDIIFLSGMSFLSCFDKPYIEGIIDPIEYINQIFLDPLAIISLP